MRASRKAGWAIADQALSSLTNALVAVVVARSTSAQGFGAFSLAFLIYAILLGVSTAAAAEPLLVVHGTEDDDEFRTAARHALGTALVLGVLFGAIAAGTAAMVRGDVGGPLAALAVALPGLLVQDAVRHVFFARGRPQEAAATDGAWALCQAIVFTGVLVADSSPPPAVFVLAWGGSAGIAAFVGCRRASVPPAPGAVWPWLCRHRVLGRALTVDFLVMTGAGHLAVYVAAATAGLAAVAAFRGVHVLFGPLALVASGLRPFVLREGAELRERAPEELTQRAATLAAMLGGFAALWGVGLLLLPTDAGRAVLGDSWAEARSLVAFMTVSIAARCLATSPYWGLRALTAGRRIVRARVVDAALTLTCSVWGALTAGARGAAAGMAVANAVAAAVWWGQFQRACREHRIPTARQ